jgi:hypothetical protein
MIYENFTLLSNGKDNIVNNMFASSFVLNNNKPRYDYNDILLFNISKTILKITIIISLIGSFLLVIKGVCSNEFGCNNRLIFINALILLICIYVLSLTM